MPNYRNEINIPQEVIHNESGLNYQQNINNNNVNNNSPDNVNNREVINGAHLNSNRPITKPKKKNFFQRTTKCERIIAILAIIAIIIFIVLLVIGDGLSNYEPPLVVAKKYGNFTLDSVEDENETSTLTPIYNVTEVYYVNTNLQQFKIPPPQNSNDLLKNENSNDYISICNTKECSEAAENILYFMNQNIDPCDDFYDYACGNFINETVIPTDKTSVDVFSLLGDQLIEQIKTLVTEPAQDNAIEPLNMVNKYYNACMNTELIAKLNFEPLMNITENLGGWPVLKGEEWNESLWNLEDTLIKLRNYGLDDDYVFNLGIETDLKNSTRRMIGLDQPDFTIEREYLIKGLDDVFVTAYYHYMVDVAVIFGADGETAEDELEATLSFEIELAKISLPAEERRNLTKLWHPISIADFQLKYPYFNWFMLINGYSTLKVDENEIINNGVETYFSKLENLLNITSKRTIANYIMWRIHSNAIFYLTENLRETQLDFASKLYGNKARKPRWRECLEATKTRFTKAISSLYVRKYFLKESKATAIEMINELRESFKKILIDVDWMDDDTKQLALMKLERMTSHVAYPDELLDDQKIIEYYKDLEIDENSFYKSSLKLDKFYKDKSFDKLRKPINKTDWETHSNVAQINAYYNILENSINIPAAILQGRFFSANRPSYLNFGGIGYVIGHEITHGFDDLGRQFDLDGNLVEWWAPETRKLFIAKAQNIIEQYGNYTDPTTGLEINGIITQGENIADSGGVKGAYGAYKNWIKQNGDEAKLPGLEEFTSEQMYWINSAQIWCSTMREEALRKVILTDSHPPGRYRIIGPFSNRKEFSGDFNCPENSKMNPSIKHNVW